MALEDEVLEFTRSFFRCRPDLSTLTLSTVRQKFLAHTGRDHLRPEEKQALKRLVEEELLSMQVEDAGSREEKLGFTKAKRPPAPGSDTERKRFRFNSESGTDLLPACPQQVPSRAKGQEEPIPALTSLHILESSSAASSPDCLGSPAKDETVEEESPRQTLKKTVENIAEQQRDLVAKMGLEESSEEEGEASVRTRKVLEEESSEEGDEKEKEQKGRTKKEHGTKSKLVAEPVQRRKKVRGKRGAKSHKGEESEEEEEPRARGNRGEGAAWGGTSCKQKSKDGRLKGDLGGSEEEKEAAGSGDDSGGDENSPIQRKSKDKTQLQGGASQSGSSEDEDSRKMQATAQGTAKTDRQGSTSGESDTEREVSDCDTGGSPNRVRKNRSSKGSKKSRTRSCSSSSSDGSPEPQKVRRVHVGWEATIRKEEDPSTRRGEDHPAVVRLKRYIRACGAYRNYKKLLGSCRSHKERLSVLRSELEALGMKGNPSLEKCRALKEQREEAAEMASLDVANIISSSGRPRRRTAWNPSGETVPPRELYHRTLESEDEQPRQAPPDWSHMRGIISSDGESN
uniref:HIRA interacting protein 3 n=1 Tax=Jaculus jaculus TaxID=51337 RepID=A0A8C5P1H8_JACJA